MWEPPISFSLWMAFQATNLMVAQCRTVLRESAMEPTGKLTPQHTEGCYLKCLLGVFHFGCELCHALPLIMGRPSESIWNPQGPDVVQESISDFITRVPPVGLIPGGITDFFAKLPSGKRLHSYGKPPFFMGKSTISTGPFSIANC